MTYILLSLLILTIIAAGYNVQIGFRKFSDVWVIILGNWYITIADPDGAPMMTCLKMWRGIIVSKEGPNHKEGDLLEVKLRLFYSEWPRRRYQ